MFFFAFGLTLDPGDAVSAAWIVAAAVLLSFVLNTAAGIVAARLVGEGADAAARISLTVLARGEFSLIIASLAAEAGLDARIPPFVGLYVFVLALASPVLASAARVVVRPPHEDRSNASVSASAGKNSSTASSSSVMSRGVPNVVSVVNRDSTTPPSSRTTGTSNGGSSHAAPRCARLSSTTFG